MLERLIGRCLAKDPELRWQTARDLATELRWFAETRPDKAAAGHSSRALEQAGSHRRRTRDRDRPRRSVRHHRGVDRARKQPPVAEYTQVTYRRGAVSSARFAPDGQTLRVQRELGRRAVPRVSRAGGEPGRSRSRSRRSDAFCPSHAPATWPCSLVHRRSRKRLARARWQAFRWRAARAAICSTASSTPTGFPAATISPSSVIRATAVRGPSSSRPARRCTKPARPGRSASRRTEAALRFFEGPAIFDGATDANVVVIDRTGRDDRRLQELGRARPGVGAFRS